MIDNQIILVPEPEQEFESICGLGAELDEKTDECIIPAEFESSEVFPAQRNQLAKSGPVP